MKPDPVRRPAIAVRLLGLLASALVAGAAGPAAAAVDAAVHGTRSAGDPGDVVLQDAGAARVGLRFFDSGNTAVEQSDVYAPAPGSIFLGTAFTGQSGVAAAAIDGVAARARLVAQAFPDPLLLDQVGLDAGVVLEDTIFASGTTLGVDLQLSLDELQTYASIASSSFFGRAEVFLDLTIEVPPFGEESPLPVYHAALSAYSRVELDGSSVEGYSIVEQVGDGDPVIVAEGEGAVFPIPHLLAVDESLGVLPGPLTVTMHFDADADCQISDGNCLAKVRTNEASLELSGPFVSTNGYQYLAASEPSTTALGVGVLATLGGASRRDRRPGKTTRDAPGRIDR